MTDAAPSPEAEPGFAAFADEMRRTGLLSDPWYDGVPRFQQTPIVLPASVARELESASEDVALLHQRLAEIVRDDPSLLASFFGLTPCQQLMFLAVAPRWHGVARTDVFLTEDGVRVCEMNSDTPSGQAEAVLLGRAAARSRPDCRDPNAAFSERFAALISAHGRAQGVGERPRVGIVYPTEMPEDLSMIRLYRDVLAEAGMRVVLGAPFNLSARSDGGVALFGEPIDVLVRHYKTDWWGERESPWDDEAPPPDAEPLADELAAVLAAEASGRLTVVNPFGAVLTQNKRSYAFLWEERARFSTEDRARIERVLPPTFRLETCDPARLAAERDQWVLKSDYGCEGAEVVIGAVVDDAVWRASLEHARPGRWIAQKRFVPLCDERHESANYGVYLIAGRAAGFFVRLQRGATDVRARAAPVLIAGDAP